MQGRVDPGRDSGRDRDRGGNERELERGRQPFLDQRGDLAPLAQAESELATRRIGNEPPELN